MVPPEARDGVAEDHFVTSRGGLNPGSPRTIVPGYHFTPRGPRGRQVLVVLLCGQQGLNTYTRMPMPLEHAPAWRYTGFESG